MPPGAYSPDNPSTPPQSIPLQDLSRPPDEASELAKNRHRSGSAWASLGNRAAFSGRVKTSKYETLLNEPPKESTSNHLDVPLATTPRTAHRTASGYEEPELSPIDIGGFSEAMGGMGLFLDGEELGQPGLHSSFEPARETNLTAIPEDSSSLRSQSLERDPGENDDYNADPRIPEEQTPLTSPRFLQAIDGSDLPNASRLGPGGNPRHSPCSSRGMLGEDLNQAEFGIGHRHDRSRSGTASFSHLSRSLSTSGNPLSSASDMLRKMSQRVVNLSNEPEVIEQAARRQALVHEDGGLQRPPVFSEDTEYVHDAAGFTPLEKAPPLMRVSQSRDNWQLQANPLKERSLGVFSSNNPIRLWLCELLVHPATEPTILILIVLQTIVLTVDAVPTVDWGQRSTAFPSQTSPSSYTDWIMLILFILYTLEIVAKVIVSGFIRNPKEYSTLRQGTTVSKALLDKGKELFAPQRQASIRKSGATSVQEPQPSILRSFTGMKLQSDGVGHGRQAQRIRLARRAFLRHSFNRLDFLAVVAYWIAFVLRTTSKETNRYTYVFQMLSCLRITRLLGLTNGTSVILRSLKKAAPSLLSVAFLISFFWLLFGIIGAQAFKASLRRTCVWFGDTIEEVLSGTYPPDIWSNSSLTYNQNVAPQNIQLCGGHFDALNNSMMPYITNFTWPNRISSAAENSKGFICPQRSLCIEGDNPYNNTVSFDDILHSLELVFVVMSSNTFSDLLYYTTDSDYLAAAIFFAAGIFFMSFWMTNLLIAVITHSFQVIREENKVSAFTTDDQPLTEDEAELRKKTPLKRAYDKTFWVWIALIVVSLAVQSFRSADIGPAEERFLAIFETTATMILLVDIVLRFLSDWRNFWRRRENWFDLFLGVVTAIIQLPWIHNSGRPYEWMTIFQILRIYRVVLAVPLTRSLILKVLGNVSGILNLIMFVFLVTFLASLFAMQILQGDIYGSDPNSSNIHFTFGNLYLAFLGMYQVLSSENWTVLMYNATQFQQQWNTAWISACFFILWFIFANFIIVSMFIAVVQENFDVSEDEKRLQQVKAFLQEKEVETSTHGNLSLSTIFGFGGEKSRKRNPVDYGPATIEMFKDTVVRDFLDEQIEAMDEELSGTEGGGRPSTKESKSGVLVRIWRKIKTYLTSGTPNPFYTHLSFSRQYEELDPRMLAQEIQSATEQRKADQRRYLQEHPWYNVSLYIFKSNNKIRRLCQQMVGPGRGSRRIEGVDPIKAYWFTFSFIIYATICAMVLLACVATPLYQLEWYDKHGGFTIHNWFVWTDMGFAVVFTIEAAVKIIADGFVFTPNAYFRGSWGFIDGIVLGTLWASVITEFLDLDDISRAVGAFKALRALRLLNISDSARDTFHSVIILGGWKVVSAALVSLSLLVPFAIYGVNLFNGQFDVCNDSSFYNSTLSPYSLSQNCIGEWQSTPFSNNWQVIAPRRFGTPYYNFDNFGNSLFILFQIVSQEGWIDVMWSAMCAVGKGFQPQYYASQGNAVFFIAFNLLGAVFILTLFVSVFMRNYTEQTGVAFLTAEQRSWLELRKLLRRISPSKRPSNKPNDRWKSWCYKVAVKKHGRWHRFITLVLILHLVMLVIEYYPQSQEVELIRDSIFLLFTAIYIANIVIRIVGLSWQRFRRSSWDLFSIFAVSGAAITTILDLSRSGHHPVYRQLHKTFLVLIALLLIPRNNALDQLFKTAAASLTAIANLLATWLVLFLVYAIALTQTLGLTKFGSQAKANLNFRTVPNALILLFRMSCGEGWNQIMEDYANAVPPTCNVGAKFTEGDCGSAGWARSLFVSWNIVSMYIFVSLFISLIFESFSYVYQRSTGLQLVNREEIRRFKQAWATFDPDGTGYISKDVFPRLLGELSGVFEMRIYDGDHTVHRLLEDCAVSGTGNDSQAGVVSGIDLSKLNERLDTISVGEIRRRRQRLNVFSQEVIVSADPDRGISFTSCLMILAHYNVISDSRSLRLAEFLRRRYRLQRVEEEVNRRIVIGFFDTLYWLRQFRKRQALRKTARMVNIPQFSVPEILVEDQDALGAQEEVFSDSKSMTSSKVPPMNSILEPKDEPDALLRDAEPPSPQGLSRSNASLSIASTSNRSRSNTALTIGSLSNRSRSNTVLSAEAFSPRARADSNSSSPSRSQRPSPNLSPRRVFHDEELNDPFSLYDGTGGRFGGERRGSTSAIETETIATNSTTRHRHRRQKSSVNMNAMDVFDNSAWGESIRRSFTQRRTPTRKARLVRDANG